jgi:CrcB protein
MDQRATTRPRPPWHGQWTVIGVVALGGGAGAAARYGAGRLWPTARDGFPWTTLGVNATGCALIGVLMVVIMEAWAAHRLLRPFIGTGVLGGYTTFSTYAEEVEQLVDAGRARAALAYMTLTVVAALAAVWLGATATRVVVRRWRGRG